MHTAQELATNTKLTALRIIEENALVDFVLLGPYWVDCEIGPLEPEHGIGQDWGGIYQERPSEGLVVYALGNLKVTVLLYNNFEIV